MKIWNRCRRAVWILLFALLIPISAYVFYGALDTLEGAGTLQRAVQGKMVPVFLLGTSFVLCIFLTDVFRRTIPWLERRRSIAVPALFALMAAGQVLMVLTVRTSLRYDHLKIFDTAVALLQQDTVADTHFCYYFMKYPNNLPVCLFTSFWLRLASLAGVPKGLWMEYVKLLNLLCMNLGLLCAFSLICKYRSRKTGLFFLMLLLVNPLWYLLGQMYYTSTISLAFSMGAVWLYDRASVQKVLWKKYLQYVLMGMLLYFGYKIRATMVITIAALLIWTVLKQERLRIRPKEAAGFLAVFLGMLLVCFAYGQAEKRYAGFDPSKTGYPMVHWVMMSAQGEGQYNSADDAYTGSFSTREERTEADLKRLQERIAEMGPGGILTLFRNKLRVAFSDGTDDYQALFRSMRETSRLQKYINGGRSDPLALYLHSYHGMLTGLLVLALVFRICKRERGEMDLFALQICGAYMFYLIWEVDRAYSIPFILLFLMWAAVGMETVSDRLEDLAKRHPAFRRLPGLLGGCLILLFAGVILLVLKNGGPVREYAVLQDQETSESLTLQTEFAQTFRTDRAFDHIDLWVANWDGGANDSVYEIKVLDENGAAAARGEVIGSAAPCMAPYTIAFEKVVPDREQTYRIEVRIKDPNCAVKTDFLYYQSGAWDTYEDGALYAPEEIEDVDLAFAVYEER